MLTCGQGTIKKSLKEDIMGNLEAYIISLKIALERTEGLKNALKEFNQNAKTLERLAKAIEKQNELKERELELVKSNTLKLK